MINKIDNAIWVSWERHRRSQSLAKKFDIPLFEFQRNNSRWLSHPVFAIRTFILLLKKKPRQLFVQNPSAFLTLLAIFFKPYFRYELIVDAHNAGVYPSEPAHEKYRCFFTFIHRHADVTIVTNNILAKIIKRNGGTAVILPDPLPDVTACRKRKRYDERFIITLICSFSIDEPYIEVFEAAALLSDEIRIYVTGNNKKLSDTERKIALNNKVILTGFLSEEDYITQLSNSDSIMVLTKRHDCMVCGAYEAVSLEKPLILSNSTVLRTYFNKGCIFTNNETNEIYNAILKMKLNIKENQTDIIYLKKDLIDGWQYQFNDVFKMLSYKAI